MKSRKKNEIQNKRSASDASDDTPTSKKLNQALDAFSLTNPGNPRRYSPENSTSRELDFGCDTNPTESFKTGQGKDSIDVLTVSSKSSSSDCSLSKGSLQMSRKSFIDKLDENFVESVVQGLESSLRSEVRSKIEEKIKLSPKQNKSVIASVNHLIFEYVGAQRPDINMCRY